MAINREPKQVTVELRTGDPMTIQLGQGPIQVMTSNHRYVIHGERSGWGAWQESKR